MESFFLKAFVVSRLIFSVFLLIGMTELLIVFFIYRKRKSLQQRGEETTGTVVDVLKGRGPKGGTTYHPVFKFTTFRNETITQRSKMGSNPAAYKTGDPVIIVYDPAKPENYLVRGDKRYRFLYILLGGLAAVFILIGLYGLLPLVNLKF